MEQHKTAVVVNGPTEDTVTMVVKYEEGHNQLKITVVVDWYSP